MIRYTCRHCGNIRDEKSDNNYTNLLGLLTGWRLTDDELCSDCKEKIKQEKNSPPSGVSITMEFTEAEIERLFRVVIKEHNDKLVLTLTGDAYTKVKREIFGAVQMLNIAKMGR